MKLRVLATGSQANCYLLEDGSEALILDAGLPMKRITPHISDLRNVKACLVTHEHRDHAKGAFEIARRGVHTYCSEGTAKALGDCNSSVFKTSRALVPFKCGRFTVMGFETQHDAAEPFGFLIRNEETKESLVYATDTYYIRYTFPNVRYWVVECNYCDDMLERRVDDGSVEGGLRRRIKESHMSLKRLKVALAVNDLKATSKIILVHLSDSNSDEQRMVREIEELTGIETVAATNGGCIDLDEIPF